jgi:SurA N-terminal domain
VTASTTSSPSRGRPRLARLAPRAAATAVVVAVVLLAVTACGTDLHPGTAATVGDTTIGESEVEDLVVAACSFTEETRIAEDSGSDPTQSIANLRRSVTQQLIQTEVTNQATQELGLTISESTASSLAAQSVDSIPDGVSPEDRELLEEFFTEQSRSLLGQGVIGAHLRDESITVGDEGITQDDVDGAQEYLAGFAADLEIEVNPAFGTWEDGEVLLASGSLSDPVSDVAEAAFSDSVGSPESLNELPASQVCG